MGGRRALRCRRTRRPSCRLAAPIARVARYGSRRRICRKAQEDPRQEGLFGRSAHTAELLRPSGAETTREHRAEDGTPAGVIVTAARRIAPLRVLDLVRLASAERLIKEGGRHASSVDFLMIAPE